MRIKRRSIGRVRIRRREDDTQRRARGGGRMRIEEAM